MDRLRNSRENLKQKNQFAKSLKKSLEHFDRTKDLDKLKENSEKVATTISEAIEKMYSTKESFEIEKLM